MIPSIPVGALGHYGICFEMVPSVKWLQYKRRDLNSDPQHSCKEASVAACVCKLSFDGSRTAASPEAHCPASLTKSVSSSFGEKPVSKNTGEGHLRKTLPFPKHVHVHGHSNTNKKQDPLFWHYLFVGGGIREGSASPPPRIHCKHMEVRGQVSVIPLLLPTCGIWGWNSGCQGWQEIPLPTEQS